MHIKDIVYNNKGVYMREIIHHLLGSCGETHISIVTLLSSGVAILCKDYIIYIIREVRDEMFK
tara:strand:- start:445 stop:633 length:189 start_codon:yes stop_codon:yes gene_type:complete